MSELVDEERHLVAWLADMNEDDALALANRMLLEDTKVIPMRVLELCRAAMDIVGKRFEEGEYFLPELVLAGEMLDTIGADRQAAASRRRASGAARRSWAGC
jgi:methanogenic corrinoid protein MtbC1